MNIVCIVQARTSSMRLPSKVLKPLAGEPAIVILLKRLELSKQVSKIVLATTTSHSDDKLVSVVEKIGFSVFRGDEKNVLGRYVEAARWAKADVIVRITGDCPLIDPEVVDQVVGTFKKHEVDYVSNVNPPTFPDGMDVEVFSYDALLSSYKQAKTLDQKEHVTVFLRESNKFKTKNIFYKKDLSKFRLTLDTIEDYVFIESIFEHFKPNIFFSLAEIGNLINDQVQSNKTNVHSSLRNQGRSMNSGQKLWRRAKSIIPAGNMLLSKRPEMFLPDHWPAYYSQAHGCEVWDLDKKKYFDFCLMGVGTNILGYCNPEVDEAVTRAVTSGNMSTLNCPEEVYLAERLIDMHPFADMARFCRTGGEANAVAIRLARAATGRETVAICGYHGWHDWYLATNLRNPDALDSHLLSGLSTGGVPRSLKGTTLPFDYNRIDQLKKIISTNKLAAIKMEVIRNHEPADNFLRQVRELADQHGIVLIFDECTSGFRETFGGIHKKFGVEPDVAILGKAMGNGYAITAVIGCQSVMREAENSFISSTFWTERIGFVAALATLNVMEREKSWETITAIGNHFRSKWKTVARSNNLQINFSGLPSLGSFTLVCSDALKYKTFISQEMLKRGFLASNMIYTSIAHKADLIDEYFENLEPIFEIIKSCEDDALNINELLDGPVCHDSFARLN